MPVTTPISKFAAPFTLHRFGAFTSDGKGHGSPGVEQFQPVQNEIQVLGVRLYAGPQPDGGSLRLSWNGVDAGWAAWATDLSTFAAAVQTALRTIPALAGNVVAVGTETTDSAGNVIANVSVTFGGALANAPQPMISVTDGALTAQGATLWGFWDRKQAGVAANTPLSVLGSFQPLNPREVMLLPEGQRATETAKFYSEAVLQMEDQVGKTPPDRIDYRGRSWEVQNVTTYQQELGPPYYKYMLNLVEVDR